VCVCVCVCVLDDPLNLGLYNMIYFSIIKILKKLTLYNKLKQVSIFIYSTWYIYLFHMTTNLHANSLVGQCAYLNLEVIFMIIFYKKKNVIKKNAMPSAHSHLAGYFLSLSLFLFFRILKFLLLDSFIF
jgi:hypothetical protein